MSLPRVPPSLAYGPRAIAKRRRPRHLEDSQQELLFRWMQRVQYRGHPLERYAWHTPNGGKRNAREAARLKAMGVKAGVPDVFVAIPMNGWSGLFIELKCEGRKTTGAQERVIAMLIGQGYRVEVTQDKSMPAWRQAARSISDYLGVSYDY